MRSRFKRFSEIQDQIISGTATVVTFPRSKAQAPIPVSTFVPKTSHEQYLIQKAMLDKNIAAMDMGPLDLAKKNQTSMFNETAAVQASSLKHENINAMFSSAFAHIAPGPKLKY